MSPAATPPVVFTLDNNVLSRYLNADDTAKQLTELIQGANVRVIVPSAVMLEATGGKIESNVLDRFSRLAGLHTALPDMVQFGHLVQDMMFAEQKALGSIRSTPIVAISRLKRSYVYHPEYFKLLYPEVRADQEALDVKHEARAGDDEKAREFARVGDPERGLKPIDQKWLKEIIHSYEPKYVIDHLTVIDRDMESFITLKKFAKRVNNEGFRVVTAFSHFLLLRYMLVACHSPDHIIAGMAVLNKNNWVDISIAATAAYSDFFVTEDKNLRKITNFLKEKGVVGFSGLTIGEFEQKLDELSE